MGRGGRGARSAQPGAGHLPTLGLGFPSSEGAIATSFGVSRLLESPLLPVGGPSASLRYTAVSFLRARTFPHPSVGPGVLRSGAWWCWGNESPHAPPPAWATYAHTHTHIPREQAELSLSHRGTHPRPPAPASWKQSPAAGRWSSLATPERPSPALHPHSDGSASVAASGPLPCWNEPSALEFVEKSGVSCLLFFLARPYHKLVGKPEG